MNELEALAERCGKAEGADTRTAEMRSLNADILRALGWREAERDVIDPSGNLAFQVPYYVGSIDVAMTLVPEGYPARQVGSTDDGRGYAAVAGNDMHMMAEDPEEFFAEGNSATPALALVAAALRARARALAPAIPV